jgi:multidrug resistance protein MdtO
MRSLANEVSGKPSHPVPDLHDAAQRLDQAVHAWYQQHEISIPPEASDVAGLADSLATILAPLYDEIHATFASQRPALTTV